MAESGVEDVAIRPGYFSKKVPATSVSPTYKLTLPSEVVSATLSHLVEKEFQLVGVTGEQTWTVSIIPRKNKDKFEYTLQGWRAFAEDQAIRTGDLLEFVLLGDEQLQADITRRAPPVEEVLAALQSSGAEAASLRNSSVNPTEASKYMQQAMSPPASVGRPLSNGALGHALAASPRSALAFHPDEMDILELGHDPRDQGLSPVLSKLQQGAGLQISHPDDVPSLEASDLLDQLEQLLGFRRSSESDTLAFVGVEEQLLHSQDTPREALQSLAAKRQRRASLTEGPQALGSLPENLLISHRRPVMRGTPATFSLHSPEVARARHTLQRDQRDFAGVELADGAAAANAALVSQEDAPDLGLLDLRRTLSTALIRAARAERETASLLAAWRSAMNTLEEHTTQGLSMATALFGVTDRMGSADLVRLLEPRHGRELSLLQSEMRHYINGLLQAFWRIRHLRQQNEYLDLCPTQH